MSNKSNNNDIDTTENISKVSKPRDIVHEAL